MNTISEELVQLICYHLPVKDVSRMRVTSKKYYNIIQLKFFKDNYPFSKLLNINIMKNDFDTQLGYCVRYNDLQTFQSIINKIKKLRKDGRYNKKINWRNIHNNVGKSNNINTFKYVNKLNTLKHSYLDHFIDGIIDSNSLKLYKYCVNDVKCLVKCLDINHIHKLIKSNFRNNFECQDLCIEMIGHDKYYKELKYYRVSYDNLLYYIRNNYDKIIDFVANNKNCMAHENGLKNYKFSDIVFCIEYKLVDEQKIINNVSFTMLDLIVNKYKLFDYDFNKYLLTNKFNQIKLNEFNILINYINDDVDWTNLIIHHYNYNYYDIRHLCGVLIKSGISLNYELLFKTIFLKY
jgi:hypothetical protein